MTPADLKAERKARGLSQKGLAATLGLSADNGDRTIRRWEKKGPVPAWVPLALKAIPKEK